jgi:hypothetical protein
MVWEGIKGQQTIIPDSSDYWLVAVVVGILSFMVMVLCLFEKSPNPPRGWTDNRTE